MRCKAMLGVRYKTKSIEIYTKKEVKIRIKEKKLNHKENI